MTYRSTLVHADATAPSECRIAAAAALGARGGSSKTTLGIPGLCGYSRLQELVFGDVTRSLLADPPMPLFASH